MAVSELEALRRYEADNTIWALALAKKAAVYDQNEIGDLIQEGRIGLVLAARRAKCFERSYFRRTAVGCMLHYLRDRRNVIRIPAYRQEQHLSSTVCYLFSWFAPEETKPIDEYPESDSQPGMVMI